MKDTDVIEAVKSINEDISDLTCGEGPFLDFRTDTFTQSVWFEGLAIWTCADEEVISLEHLLRNRIRMQTALADKMGQKL